MNAFLLSAQSLVEALQWERFDHFGNYLAQYLGSWIMERGVFGITWLQLLLSSMVLLFTLAVSFIAQFLRHSKAQKNTPTDPIAGTTIAGSETIKSSTLTLVLEALRRPLILLIWAWGLFSALWLLLFHLKFSPDLSWILFSLQEFLRVANYLALFWALLRLVAVMETKMGQRTTPIGAKWDDILCTVGIRALRLVLPLVGLLIIIPTLEIPPVYHDFLKQAVSLLIIGGVGYIMYELTITTEKAVLGEYCIDGRDNLAGRKIHTQVHVLKRIVSVMIIIITVALMLMVFEPVRQLGKSMLASAGVAGIVIGFAAQRSLATLVAGIQIAFTQPIRIDDVVIVEGEWGRIEEITMSYVVVLIWDLRRLIVPITYFIEKPFQNWTRVNANLLGTVMLYVDYTVNPEALRTELDRILAASKLWDEKVKVLQITDAKEHTIEVRILVSAADAGSAFDLRCEVREKMIGFVQQNFPQCLPRIRAETFATLRSQGGSKSETMPAMTMPLPNQMAA